MRREDLTVAVICLAVAAVVAVQSVPHYFSPQGTLGSGVYPCVIAALLAICGLSILIQWLRGNRQTNTTAFLPRGRGGKLLAYTAASLVAYRIGLDILGFTLASFLLMIFQMRLLGHHRWWSTLVLSALFVGFVSYTFSNWLYMDLPRGFIKF
jgi:hypothetical protein